MRKRPRLNILNLYQGQVFYREESEGFIWDDKNLRRLNIRSLLTFRSRSAYLHVSSILLAMTSRISLSIQGDKEGRIKLSLCSSALQWRQDTLHAFRFLSHHNLTCVWNKRLEWRLRWKYGPDLLSEKANMAKDLKKKISMLVIRRLGSCKPGKVVNLWRNNIPDFLSWCNKSRVGWGKSDEWIRKSN